MTKDKVDFYSSSPDNIRASVQTLEMINDTNTGSKSITTCYKVGKNRIIVIHKHTLNTLNT